MEYRELGRTGWQVSAISFGAGAIGGTWSPVNDKASLATLHRALDLGVCPSNSFPHMYKRGDRAVY